MEVPELAESRMRPSSLRWGGGRGAGRGGRERANVTQRALRARARPLRGRVRPCGTQGGGAGRGRARKVEWSISTFFGGL